MKCTSCHTPLSPEDKAYWEGIWKRDDTPEDEQDYHPCGDCFEAEIAGENASLEAAESGAGLEQIRDWQFHCLYDE